jgi:uncharacterized protein DUF4058
MPSPFPGMDPYLEGSFWTVFHTNFVGEIARYLAPIIRPRYLALSNERFVLEIPEDVEVDVSGPCSDVSAAPPRRVGCGAGAALAASSPIQLKTVILKKVPHVSLEILDAAEQQLVTSIEILSPRNKRGEGRAAYLENRGRVLMSSTRLIEIDLLRQGQRLPMRKPLPAAPYFVFVGRREKRPVVEVWPVTLASTLPVIAVPLLPGDPDVPLDLQRVFTATYDAYCYDLALKYAKPAEVPLEGEDKTPADQLLRSAGLRR